MSTDDKITVKFETSRNFIIGLFADNDMICPDDISKIYIPPDCCYNDRGSCRKCWADFISRIEVKNDQ